MPKEPYTGSDIEHLSGLEAIRRRPAMYASDSTGRPAPNVLLEESLCIALDALLANNATEVNVRLDADGSATVEDNGPGLPLEPLDCGKTLQEYLFTETARGCWFHKSDPEYRELCAGGVVCVTALSKWLVVDNARDGYTWRTRFQESVAVGPVERLSATASSGLRISFLPDPQFFGELKLCADRLQCWWKHMPFQLPENARFTVQAADGKTTQIC